MPYANNGQISQNQIEGGIEITQEQYNQAIAGMLEGLEVTITDGFKVAAKPDPVAPAPPIPTLDELKAAKLASINTDAQATIAPYVQGYPKFEIDTWPSQKAEAGAYALNTAAATPFCDLAAAERGIDRVTFIGKVQAKVTLFTQVSATVAGYRQGLEDKIAAITDPATGPAALDAIVWTSPI